MDTAISATATNGCWCYSLKLLLLLLLRKKKFAHRQQFSVQWSLPTRKHIVDTFTFWAAIGRRPEEKKESHPYCLLPASPQHKLTIVNSLKKKTYKCFTTSLLNNILNLEWRVKKVVCLVQHNHFNHSNTFATEVSNHDFSYGDLFFVFVSSLCSLLVQKWYWLFPKVIDTFWLKSIWWKSHLLLNIWRRLIKFYYKSLHSLVALFCKTHQFQM